MPFVLLTSSLMQPAFLLPDGIPDSLAGVFLGALCLLLCVVLGAVLLFCADVLSTKKRYLVLCVAAIAVTMASLFVPFMLGKVVLTTFGFACCYVVWKVYILNKRPKTSSVLASLVCSGIFFTVSSLLDTPGALFIPAILVLVSLLAFLSVSDECFKSWVFTPKESIQHLDFSFSIHIFPFFISLVYGVAISTMTAFDSLVDVLVLMGAASVIAAASIYTASALPKQPSRSFSRGLLAVGACCAIIVMAVTQGIVQSLLSAALLSALIVNKHANDIRHSGIQKDAILSEAFLSGYRILTSALGVFVGFVACAWVTSSFPVPSSPHFAFYGLTACLFLCGSLINLGVFDAKRDRLPTSKIADPWHEKVMYVAHKTGLSPRQTEIFNALSRGRNTKYIMQRLYLSEGTVKKQAFQIYRKLDVHTQQELITLVMDTRLDDDGGG